MVGVLDKKKHSLKALVARLKKGPFPKLEKYKIVAIGIQHSKGYVI